MYAEISIGMAVVSAVFFMKIVTIWSPRVMFVFLQLFVRFQAHILYAVFPEPLLVLPVIKSSLLQIQACCCQ